MRRGAESTRQKTWRRVYPGLAPRVNRLIFRHQHSPILPQTYSLPRQLPLFNGCFIISNLKILRFWKSHLCFFPRPVYRAPSHRHTVLVQVEHAVPHCGDIRVSVGASLCAHFCASRVMGAVICISQSQLDQALSQPV